MVCKNHIKKILLRIKDVILLGIVIGMWRTLDWSSNDSKKEIIFGVCFAILTVDWIWLRFLKPLMKEN